MMRSPILILFALTVSCFGQSFPGSAAYQAAFMKPATGAAGPTLIAQDNFDSYANLSSLGAAADWVDNGAAMIVSKPASDGAIITASGSAIGLAYHTATFSANQRAEITIEATVAGGNFDWLGPAVRIQAGAVTGYGVVFSSTDLYLVSFNAGTQATIVSDTGMTLSAGNRIAIEASGTGAATRLKVQIDTGSGWVDKWTNRDPAVDIDGGSPGVCSWLLNNPSNKLDDWKGYDL
jgi:hypothetical protein